MSELSPEVDLDLLAEHLAEIARMLLAPSTVAEVLTGIVDLAIKTIDGCDQASLCAGGEEATTVSSSDLVAALDRLQTELGEGPCPDAIAGADSVYVADLRGDLTWPRFGPAAVAKGMRTALAYRLLADGETLGALQLYATGEDAFDRSARAEGLLFAAHAGMALGVARTQAADRVTADGLRAAMLSREVIGQAQGILMERERVTGEQAFDLLRRASQDLNRKLRDVAQELVDTGSVPGRPGLERA